MYSKLGGTLQDSGTGKTVVVVVVVVAAHLPLQTVLYFKLS